MRIILEATMILAHMLSCGSGREVIKTKVQSVPGDQWAATKRDSV